MEEVEAEAVEAVTAGCTTGTRLSTYAEANATTLSPNACSEPARTADRMSRGV